MNPKDCKYSKGHTWVRVAGGEAIIGITDYAQQQMGSILFVETKEVGSQINQFQPCGTVESDKATSDVMSPISGEVVAVNQEAVDAPELLNQDPYGAGWLLKARPANPKELDDLMTAEQFEAATSQ
ncbi:MAG: glycine cleavage system protein GcvH [Chloroflexi bacterium]|nr:glycine cleavage system protein GcvH [Chloroflexota bacterium]